MTRESNISVYVRGGRPTWTIAYLDPASLKRVFKATPFSAALADGAPDLDGKRKAYDMAAKLAQRADDEFTDLRAERWERWVEPHLTQRYRRMPGTLNRYLTCWKFIRSYLLEKKIHGPRTVTLQTIRDYLDWRVSKVKKSGKSVSHNTAVLDIKMLQVVLNEAVRRDWISRNPCREVGINRIASKKKREITDEEMEIIVAALDAKVKAEPGAAWMRTAWEIARWQGCRLGETQLDLTRDVNLNDETITFHAKGKDGQPHIFETKLHPNLKPLFVDMIARRQVVTLRFPKMGTAKTGAASKLFRQFLDQLQLRDLSFHCTRVTVITKLARSGVPISQAMAFVGHADEEVHRIYQKLKARDLGQAANAVSYTRKSEPNSGSSGAVGIS